MLKDVLRGKKAFIVGVGDDAGYGFAIAKSLSENGVQIILGTWVPIYSLFIKSLSLGKFDSSRRLSDGTLMEFSKIYPIDVSFDSMEQVPEEIKANKRYKDVPDFAIQEVVKTLETDFGQIDFFIHSLANGPEVHKPLLETSRKGYLDAISTSSYSFISLLSHLGPKINSQGAALSLTYIASEKVIPGYGGGMSSAKAALESDTRTLAYEAGKKWQIRVNTISAGPLKSRAAKAIGFIDKMISYSESNSPLQRELKASDIGQAAAFLLSPYAAAITGVTLYVDNGLHAMGMASDSKSLTQSALEK